VLHAAPEVSVTRLDALRLTDLWQLAEEGAASGIVQDITRRIRSRSADPVRLEGTIQEAVSTTISVAESPQIFILECLGMGSRFRFCCHEQSVAPIGEVPEPTR
jgi:hypothetical protein